MSLKDNRTCALLDQYLSYRTIVKGRSALTADEYRIDCNMLFHFVKQKRGVSEEELARKDFSDVDIEFIKAHMLKSADQYGLRHIFVVLPYTNIISQTVSVLREALVLEGELPAEVIAEHHHQADFEGSELRHLASTWAAPIIVTTAVQFFETIASNLPARLRKLHQLPGSGIIIDLIWNAKKEVVCLTKYADLIARKHLLMLQKNFK